MHINTIHQHNFFLNTHSRPKGLISKNNDEKVDEVTAEHRRIHIHCGVIGAARHLPEERGERHHNNLKPAKNTNSPMSHAQWKRTPTHSFFSLQLYREKDNNELKL